MLSHERREPSREAVRAHDAPGRDRELAALESEVAGPQLLDLTHVLEHPNGELAQRPADVGQLDVAADPAEQREPEGRLEAAHDAADRSLRQAERLCRGGHVLALGDRQEGVELIERDLRAWMPRTRVRRSHRGVSRARLVPGGGRSPRWPRAPPRPIPRLSASRCPPPRGAPQAPRTGRRLR